MHPNSLSALDTPSPLKAGSVDNAQAGCPALELSGVTKTFGQRKALQDVSFMLPEGAFLLIFGPNGAGKSTLLRMIATLSRPTAGQISIFGEDAIENPEAIRGRIGVIAHDSLLYGDLTAQENLEFYAQLYGVADPKARAVELLHQVGLAHRRHDYVKTFSRGMTQRVSIARAFVNDPDLVLLDEPYAGLDMAAEAVFDDILREFISKKTFIMVNHNIDKGLAFATHGLLLNKGSVVAFDEKEHLSKTCWHEIVAPETLLKKQSEKQ